MADVHPANDLAAAFTASDTLTRAAMAKTMPPDMSNVLADDEKQQILALGRLGRSSRRIDAAHRSCLG